MRRRRNSVDRFYTGKKDFIAVYDDGYGCHFGKNESDTIGGQ